MEAKDLLNCEQYLALIEGLKSYGVKSKDSNFPDINKMTNIFIDGFEKATGEKSDFISSVLKNDHEDLLRYFTYVFRNHIDGKFVPYQIPEGLIQFAVVKYFPDRLADYLLPSTGEFHLKSSMEYVTGKYERASRSVLSMPEKVAPKLSKKDEQLLREAEVTASMPMPDYSGMSQKDIMNAYYNMSNHDLVPLLTEGLTAGLKFYKAAVKNEDAQDTNVSVELNTDNGLMSLYWGEDYSEDEQPFFRYNLGPTLKTCAAMLKAADESFRHSLSNWFEDAVPRISKNFLKGVEITLWVPEVGGDPYLELFL